MHIAIRLAKFGDQTDAIVTKWLKQVGDTVSVGELVLEIELAKANVEIDAPVHGILTSILVAEGQTVEVGDVLGVIATD